MLSSQLFFKDAAWRRRIDDFILLLLLLDDDDDGNKRVVGLVGRLEHEHDAFEEEEEEDDGERKASLMRHVVDFSGRVLEPALRRVDVRKEKEANGPPSKTPSTRGVVYE